MWRFHRSIAADIAAVGTNIVSHKWRRSQPPYQIALLQHGLARASAAHGAMSGQLITLADRFCRLRMNMNGRYSLMNARRLWGTTSVMR